MYVDHVDGTSMWMEANEMDRLFVLSRWFCGIVFFPFSLVK